MRVWDDPNSPCRSTAVKGTLKRVSMGLVPWRFPDLVPFLQTRHFSLGAQRPGPSGGMLGTHALRLRLRVLPDEEVPPALQRWWLKRECLGRFWIWLNDCYAQIIRIAAQAKLMRASARVEGQV